MQQNQSYNCFRNSFQHDGNMDHTIAGQNVNFVFLFNFDLVSAKNESDCLLYVLQLGAVSGVHHGAENRDVRCVCFEEAPFW